MISTDSGPTSSPRRPFGSSAPAALAAAAVLLVTLGLALAATLASAPATARSAGVGVDLGAESDRLVEELGAPGVSVAVVDSGGVTDSAHSGTDGDGREVDEQTDFVWGSVSKSFAALAVSVLAERGALEPRAPVASVLPGLRGSALEESGATIDDLVHHTSGLPHQMELTDAWDRTTPATGVVPEIAGITGLGQQGTFRYSSINYLLIQAVVEMVTQRPYADVLDEVLAGTAGVSGLPTDQAAFERGVPPGHAPYFFGEKPVDVGFDPAGLAYGYLAGTTDQLARYAGWQLADLGSGAPESVERRDGAVETGSGDRYGNGLYLEQRHDDDEVVTVARHSGAVPGFFTYLAVSPERDVGVVLVANSYGELRAGESAAAAEAFADRVMGLPSGEGAGAGTYPVVVLGGIALVAVLAVLVGWVVYSLVRRPSSRRSTVSTVLRVVVAAVVGGAVLAAGLLGVPALVGVPFGVASLWAPDVTLLFWLAMGGVFLLTAVVVAREISWHRRFAEVWSASG